MRRPFVLLVEDEDDIRELAASILREANYDVLATLNGDVALILLQEAALPIDLLLTDIVMPGEHDGFALAREAKKLRPDIKILYMTGFAGVAKIRSQGAPFGDVLQKPWRMDDLLQSVQAALRVSELHGQNERSSLAARAAREE